MKRQLSTGLFMVPLLCLFSALCTQARAFEPSNPQQSYSGLNIPELGHSGSAESKKKIKQMVKSWGVDLKEVGQASIDAIDPDILSFGASLVDSYKDHTSYQYNIMGMKATTVVRLERGKIETKIDDRLNVTIKKLHKKPELTINYSLTF